MSLTEKKKKSNKRSQDKNNKRFAVIMKKSEGLKTEIYLQNSGYSINGFIVQAIKEKIERDTGKSFDEFLKDQQQEPEEPENPKEPKSPEHPEVFKVDR